jgi:hypothetical protein
MLRDNFHRGLPPPSRSGRSIRFRNGSPLRKFANGPLELKLCSRMHCPPRRSGRHHFNRHDVRLFHQGRTGVSLKNRTPFLWPRNGPFGAAHFGIAGRVNLNAFASSDSKGSRDHHRLLLGEK